ncbi:MAG: eno [Nitrososphaeraceae archaeon]|nr:eno [Nitrososphaeraceae archaeon]
MPLISGVKGRIVFNSRGSKSIEIDVITDNKFFGRACAPSGASVGKLEAQSFSDNKPEKSMEIFNANIKKFIGIEAQDPKAIFDIIKSIDSSASYNKIGGAIAYALSIASVDSAAKALDIPLFKLLKQTKQYKFPYPLGNILGGGAHAGPGTPDIQEILACPIGAQNIMEALEMNFKKNCGFTIGKDMSLGIDFASSSIWNENKQVYDYSRQGILRDTEEQIEFVNHLINTYKLIYVEDPVHEEDFKNMAAITKKNSNCLVTGDDILVTNALRVKEAVKHGSCSGAILKVNQAGSLYDALNFAKECTNNNIRIVTSHRSGESTDSHISHIAIATGSKMLKAGIIGGERVSKLNELLRLSEYDLIDGMAEVFST